MYYMKKYLHRPYHNPSFEIETNDIKFIESLCLQYGKYLSDNALNDVYKIDAANISLYNIDEILFNMTTYDENILPIHGAAVEYNGYVYIFLAPTTTGKTTLVTYLINNSFGYVTEDCVLLDKQTFKVYPYTCPIHLRAGGYEVLKRYGIHIAVTAFGEPADIKYVYTPDNCVTEQLPLGRIYFIERSETENRVVEMNTAENMIELMKSTMTPQQPSSEYVRLIAKLAKIGSKRLIYCDMEYVRDILLGE